MNDVKQRGYVYLSDWTDTQGHIFVYMDNVLQLTCGGIWTTFNRYCNLGALLESNCNLTVAFLKISSF